MPKPKPAKKSKRNEPKFTESLTPTIPFTPALPEVSASTSRLIGYGSLAILSILVGIGVGAIYRSMTAPAELTGAPGAVAVVTNPAIMRVLDAKTLALPIATTVNLRAEGVDSLANAVIKTNDISASQSDNIQPSVSGEAYQQPVGINGVQPDYASYGVQGSVGTQRIH